MIEKPISDLINNSDIELLNIPIFQRPYSWTINQISQFISDFDNCIETPDQRHFYGLIVFVTNNQNKKIIDVIDGQQRLTTILILLSIVRDFMEDYKNNIDWDDDDETIISRTIFNIDDLLSTDLNVSKVKLKTENESNFENEFLELIQSSISLYKDKTIDPRKAFEEQPKGSKNRFQIKSDYLYNYKNDARRTRHKTSYKNYLILHDHINKKLNKKASNEERYKYLVTVYNSLINDFRVIPFHVESYEKAFEYFEVLNDRGLDVSALDLIKNQCLKITGITANQREIIFSSWSEIFSNTLDHTFNLIQFVRYSYMSVYGHITNKEIFKKYKDLLNVKDYDSIINYLDNDLLIKSKIFKDLNSSETHLDSKLHNTVHLLKSTKTVQWFSIAMAALDPVYKGIKINNSTKKIIIDLFESLHELMFTLNFVEKVANDLEKKLPEIASDIIYKNEDNFKKSLTSAKNKLDSFKIEQKLTFKNISIDDSENWVKSFEKNNSLGHMFIFFFKYKKQGSSTNKIFISSLEHTLPQKPSQDNWLIIKNEDKVTIKRNIYSLGNFFVTHSSENSSYGNKSFAAKSKLYKTDNIFDIIEETDPLHYKKVSDWTFDIIKKRETTIIKMFNELKK